MKENKLNLTMLCDFYELTMGYGYFAKGYQEQITYFDLFFRKCPDGGGFAIAAGLEQIVRYIQDLHFDQADIEYLRGRKLFSEDFLTYLADFQFTGDIWAVPEGTPIFPQEPIITVRAPAIQAQLIETYLLLCVNHQSLIATKANRVVRAAEGRTVLEFGSRRAQGADAAILGARAAYIGGAHGTACTISDQLYGVHAGGTMAHAWVQMFDSEYEAFKAYVELYPTNATLLVDTYNTLKSGVPNAIRVFNEVLKPLGITKCGIRLDSGDLAYLTQQARKMLDEAGWTDCQISVSNALDEYIIRDILRQGAKIDMFGVGERLITARSEPVFGGVYKLAAVEEPDGTIVPKIKISENVGKITNPHYKKLYRFYGKDNGKAIADYLCVYDEEVDDSRNMTIFDPEATWKTKDVYNFTAQELQVPIFKNGQLVYDLPDLETIRSYCREQVNTLWDEVKRFDNPQTYYVDLSQKLWDIKYGLLKKMGKAYSVALGGVLAALAVAAMSLGTLIPVATYVCPLFCMVLLQVVLKTCGRKIAWAWYGAVALLALLMAPDKEAAAVFVFLGYYPIVKPRLDRTKLKWFWKALLFNGATLVMYDLLIHLFGLSQISEEFAELGIAMTLVLLILGNVTFFLLDKLLNRNFK